MAHRALGSVRRERLRRRGRADLPRSDQHLPGDSEPAERTPRLSTRRAVRKGERRLACIFAHPDDETFATGGLIAKYAAAGVHVDLFCATDGGAGRSSGVPVSSPGELAELRRNELISAARFLGVRSLALPGYEDGSLTEVDPDALTADVVLALRTWRPQVVVTFGPEGAPTAHRDHRAICRAATAAFFLAGLRTAFPEQLDAVKAHRPDRLYYAAWPKLRGRPPAEQESVPPTARIDVRSWLREQMGAFLLHVTQREHMETFKSLGWTRYEHFALAAGAPQPKPVVDDLFAGLSATRSTRRA